MQAVAEATQETEAEDEGLVLLRRVHELEDDIAVMHMERMRRESWGYLRKGNAYKDRPKIDMRKERVEALDVSPHDAPHG